MTWLHPTDDHRQQIKKIKETTPEFHQLLQILSLALRIEPLLLRNARLNFFPTSEIELETDIWFSNIMHTRNAKACIMRGGIARAFVDELSQENDKVDIFPNPVLDKKLYIKSDKPIISWNLYNSTGVFIEGEEWISQKTEKVLYFTNSVKGIYFLHLLSYQNEFFVQKIVLNQNHLLNKKFDI